MFPHLITLDVMMPEVNGYEVIKSLKNNAETVDIPIVLMTGLELDGGREQALSPGVDEYFTKSGGLSRLFEVVEKIIDGKGEM